MPRYSISNAPTEVVGLYAGSGVFRERLKDIYYHGIYQLVGVIGYSPRRPDFRARAGGKKSPPLPLSARALTLAPGWHWDIVLYDASKKGSNRWRTTSAPPS